MLHIFISLQLDLLDKTIHVNVNICLSFRFVIYTSKFADLFGSDVRFSKKDKTVEKIRIHCK